jgi:hypothetical protein
MLERAELPHGCTYQEYPIWRRIFHAAVLAPSEFNMKRWEKKWSSRERWTKEICEFTLRQSVLGTLDEDDEWKAIFDAVESTSHLSMRILLARGLTSLRENKLVTVTGNRIGIRGDYNGPFAEGGRMRVSSRVRLRDGERRITGEMIGIVLNADSIMAEPIGVGSQIEVAPEVIMSLFDAVATAQLRLEEAQTQGTLGSLMSQTEIDRAFEWLLTGK